MTDPVIEEVEDIFANIYPCDPRKNTDCEKTFCMFNLDIPEEYRFCESALDEKFKWDGESDRCGHYGDRLRKEGYL